METGFGARGFGMTGYSQVDTLGWWYKLVNFGVGRGLVSPKCETESATESHPGDNPGANRWFL